MKPDQPKLCECGCGEPAPIATKTNVAKGYVRGQPLRFVHGHRVSTFTAATRRQIGATQRGRTHTDETRRRMSVVQGGTGEPGYAAIHRTLSRRHPKTGVCEECGTVRERTDYAFKRHPEPHTLDREDYRELCQPCHNRFDAG